MSPTELSKAAGISVPYASQLMSGERKCKSLAMALKIYDATGLQFGPLVNLNSRDIETLRRIDDKAQAA